MAKRWWGRLRRLSGKSTLPCCRVAVRLPAMVEVVVVLLLFLATPALPAHGGTHSSNAPGSSVGGGSFPGRRLGQGNNKRANKPYVPLTNAQMRAERATEIARRAADPRQLPRFIHQRRPQPFIVSLPVVLPAGHTADAKSRDMPQATANATEFHLALFGVVPDSVSRLVYLLFEFGWGEASPFKDAFFADCKSLDKRKCSDLLPHFTTPFLGDLRCEFVDANGTVLAQHTHPNGTFDGGGSGDGAGGGGGGGGAVRVEAHSAELSKSAAFVGVCRMPDAFVPLLRAPSALQHPPGVRVLREGDAGAPPGASAAGEAGGSEDASGRQCFGLLGLSRGDVSSDACARACYATDARGRSGAGIYTYDADGEAEGQWGDTPSVRRPRGELVGVCREWQWHAARGCWATSKSPKDILSRCKPADGWVGGRRRHPVWDAVDVAREAAQRRLISFGCSMPVFGDGAYANRIPQWIEFILYNFPDAHFFVYLRGGDGAEGNDIAYAGMPGVAGGSALLYPYVVAGVVTIVWIPADTGHLLHPAKESIQRRDENDYLYRARHLSEWASASVDYDEFFAPTVTVGNMWRDGAPGSKFADVAGAWNVDFTDATRGRLFYPLHRYLRNVTSTIQVLHFQKWPARIPAQNDDVYLATDRIGRDATAGRLGKYIFRPSHIKLVWTHMPVAPEKEGSDLGRGSTSRLVVGNTQYNLLHFRDHDWSPIADNASLHRPYYLTRELAAEVARRVWQRYAAIPEPAQ